MHLHVIMTRNKLQDSFYDQFEKCCARQHDSQVRGMSLIEMVIVLAVVVILGLSAFTVYIQQRERGYQSNCQSNLKQTFAALQMYIRDNDSRLPSLTDWASNLSPYVGSKNVFVCPSTRVHNEYHPGVDYDIYPERMSYLEISRTGKFAHPGANEASLSITDKWILMTDIGSGQEAGDQPSVVMLDYPQECARSLSNQSTSRSRHFPIIHSGGGNYLFADGHVKWLLPQKGLQTDCSAGPFLSGY